MRIQHTRPFSRRRFLGAMTLAGTAGLLGLPAKRVAAEPPPRRPRLGGCGAPPSAWPPIMSLKNCCTEGFTEVRHVQTSVQLWTQAVLSGEVDIVLNFVGPLLVRLDAGDPLVILAGGHVGCFELFGTERVRAIRDLKGKTVSVPELGSPQHVFLTSIAAHVGLDPGKEIDWVIHPRAKAMQLLTEGKIDAFLGFPPEPQELRAKGSGTWWSTARWTAPGRNTSAAWSTHAGSSSRNTRWRPSGHCAPF